MSDETYREQLDRLVAAMTVANQESLVANDLAESKTSRVKMFVDGNLEKRFDKLTRGIAFLEDAFDDLENLVLRFMREVPLAAYDTGASDAERLLSWIIDSCPITPEQRDHIACQRARHAVEDLGRIHRLKHTRFQELCSLSEQLVAELGHNPDLRVFLNPIHYWTEFETQVLLDEDAETPANVLFYAVNSDVSTAILEPEGQALLRELQDIQPCTLDVWSITSNEATREDLIELCRDMSEMGLIAFG